MAVKGEEMSFIVWSATGDKRQFVAVKRALARSRSAGFHIISRFCVATATAILVSTLSIAADANLVGVNIFDNTVYSQTSAAAPTTPSRYFFSIGGDYASGDIFGGATATFTGTASPVTTFDNNVPSPNFFNHDSVRSHPCRHCTPPIISAPIQLLPRLTESRTPVSSAATRGICLPAPFPL